MGGHTGGVSYAERMALRGGWQGWMIRERTVEVEGSEPADPPGNISVETSDRDREGAGEASGADEPHENVSAATSEWDTPRDAAASGVDAGVDAVNGAPEEERVDHEAIENDELEELGNEIATIAAHIHAAEYQLLVKLANSTGAGAGRSAASSTAPPGWPSARACAPARAGSGCAWPGRWRSCRRSAPPWRAAN